MTVGIGLTMLRVALGLLLTGHGCQKLFGWFRGHGPVGTGAWCDSVGYRPGRQIALLAGLCELISGALFPLGLLTPLAAATVIGLMLAAGAVHTSNGLWVSNGGFELPGFYVVTAAALGFTGPGRYPVDHWLGCTWSWRYGLGALVVGVVAGVAAISLRARQLHCSDSSRTHQPGSRARQPVGA